MKDLILACKIGIYFGEAGKGLQESFFYGPNPLHEQTEQGIVVEMLNGEVRRLHTPFGFWSIGVKQVDWRKVPGEFSKLDGSLVTRKTEDAKGPFYSVVQWEGKDLEPPIYRDESQYVPPSQVQILWRRFVSSVPQIPLKSGL